MSEPFKVLDQLKSPSILVIGDVILDRYIWGNVDRVSPEAPIVVLNAKEQQVQLGGAASVARLIDGLEATVSLAGVVGNDSNGRLLLMLLEESGCNIDMVLIDENRSTTTKERFMGRSSERFPYQVLRVDYEDTYELEESLEETLISEIRDRIHNFQAILIADYAKGVCTSNLISCIVSLSKIYDIPVIIDPARRPDFTAYQGAQLLKPNRLETEMATGITVRTEKDAIRAGRSLLQKHDINSVLITLDYQGMVLVATEREQWFPTLARSVYDITGAGDMVLAMIGLGIASKLPTEEIVPLANIAAGIEVESLGVDIVTREQLHRDLSKCNMSSEKVVALGTLLSQVSEHRDGNQRIVFTNGCFDLFHIGHASYLEQAANMGDVLIVAVNSDESVRKLKGDSRPVFNEQCRATLLSMLSCVDYVVVFNEETPCQLLQAIRPDVLVKGGNYVLDEVIGKEIVLENGGEVCVVDKVADVSTTNILSSLNTKH